MLFRRRFAFQDIKQGAECGNNYQRSEKTEIIRYLPRMGSRIQSGVSPSRVRLRKRAYRKARGSQKG